MFDQDMDGFWFEDSGVWVEGVPQYNCVVSNSNTPISVSRNNWNGDKLDGTGISGIIADATKIQLINITYEWYGAGEVRFGFVIDGYEHIVHTHQNGNRYTSAWAKSPFQPIRMELEAITNVSGGPFTLSQGSNSIILEGNQGPLGISQNISSPITGTTMAAANTWYPTLSLRLKTSALKGIVTLDSFQTATVDNTNLFYRLVRDANLEVAGASAWIDIPDTNSFSQYKVFTAPGAIIDANQGTAVESGFVIAGSSSRVYLSRDSSYQIGRSDLGTISDTYTLLCASNNTNKSAIVSLTWIEQR